ncbi:MAG: filamentous hemagglutinin N-terminal domain-containing protein [Simkaniaceae bacterium]|nr:filamentous hemagglutinin N-terminal domain-containing protein [Simkaniaceae bacterium]
MKKQLSLLILSCSALWGNPSIPQVMHGHAVFKNNGAELIVNADHNSIIHWENFSIGPGETARFCLPDHHSSLLNRVVGHHKSVIDGVLQSNGNVFLINPQGIVISKSGVIDVGGFFASTLDMPNQMFLEGKQMLLSGESKAAIINQGQVKARNKDITFVAMQIDNQGSLSAPKGSVNCGAGMEVYFQPDASQRIYVKKKIHVEEDEKLDCGFSHAGVVEAVQHQVSVDGNVYALAMNLSGNTEVISIDELDSMIFCDAGDGRIVIEGNMKAHHRDGKGGEIHLFGNKMEAHHATIDVSGEKGDGLIQMGRDYENRFDVQKARAIWLDRDSHLIADAKSNGNGGSIYLWGNEYCVNDARVSARGGSDGGDGGFYEISSFSHPIPRGKTDLSAPNGVAGTVCIDPSNVTITNTGNIVPTRSTPDGTEFVFNSASVELDPDQIQSLLDSANVIIDTSITNTPYGEQGNITLGIDYIYIGSNTLTMRADNNIHIASPIRTQADIVMEAQNNITMDLTIPTFNYVISDEGDISLTANNTLLIDAATSSGGYEQFGLFATLGNINIATDDLMLTTPNNQDVQISAKGDININPITDNGYIHIASGITLSAAPGETGEAYVITSDGDINIGNQKAFQAVELNPLEADAYISNESTGGHVNITSESIVLNGGASSQAARSWIATIDGQMILTGNLEMYGGSGDQDVSVFIEPLNAGLLIIQGTSHILQGGTSTDVGYATLGNKGLIQIVGSISLTGGASGGDNSVVIATSQNPGAINFSNGAVTLQGGGSVTSTSGAYIVTDSDDSPITFDANTSALNITAGSSGSNNAKAYIQTTGNNSLIGGRLGSITLTAGNASDAYITTLGSNAPISFSGTGEMALYGAATGSGKAYLSVQGSGSMTVEKPGDITLTSEANAQAYLSTNNGNITITTSGDLILNGSEGSGAASRPTYILSHGSQSIAATNFYLSAMGTGTGNQDVYLQTTGDSHPLTLTGTSVELIGGDGGQTSSYIKTLGNNSDITINAGLSVTGGIGADSVAEIIAEGNSDISIQYTALPAQSVNLVGGSGTVSYADISILGDGALSIDVSGDVQLTGGTVTTGKNADAYIDVGGAITISTSGNVNINGGSGTGSNLAYIMSSNANGDISLNADTLTIQGGSGTLSDASLKTSGTGADIKVRAGCNILGGTGTSSSAEITTEVSGNIDIEAFGKDQHLTITGGTGTTSSAGISTQVEGNIRANAGGDFQFTTLGTNNGQQVFVTSRGVTEISAHQGDIYISSGNSYSDISSYNYMILNAFTNNIFIRDGNYVKINTGGSGYMQLNAGVSVYLEGNSYLQTPSNIPITVICDSLFPVPYEYGSGGFHSAPDTSVSCSNAPLKIYTAQFTSNSIQGLLNGVRFSGSKGIEDANDREFVYYPYGRYAPPYTVYYKFTELKGQVVFNILNTAVSQLFYQIDEEPLSYQAMTLWDVFNFRSAFSLNEENNNEVLKRQRGRLTQPTARDVIIAQTH